MWKLNVSFYLRIFMRNNYICFVFIFAFTEALNFFNHSKIKLNLTHNVGVTPFNFCVSNSIYQEILSQNDLIILSEQSLTRVDEFTGTYLLIVLFLYTELLING